MRDERELVEGASRGDLTALEELLGRHLPVLLAFVRRRWGGLPANRESASDLVQSVCREVLQRIGEERFEYRGEAEFRAWLYEAALFKVKDRRKFWQAERRDPGREQRPVAPGAPGESEGAADWDRLLANPIASPSQAAEQREAQVGVHALLARLPPRYRQVIELAKIEGLNHAEVALRMEITEGTSRVLLSRALARLATLAGNG